MVYNPHFIDEERSNLPKVRIIKWQSQFETYTNLALIVMLLLLWNCCGYSGGRKETLTSFNEKNPIIVLL